MNSVHSSVIILTQSLQHISLELAAGSIIEIDQPWTTEQEGYTSVVSGKLGDVRASTSLDYHPVARAENIEVSRETLRTIRLECYHSTIVDLYIISPYAPILYFWQARETIYV